MQNRYSWIFKQLCSAKFLVWINQIEENNELHANNDLHENLHEKYEIYSDKNNSQHKSQTIFFSIAEEYNKIVNER